VNLPFPQKRIQDAVQRFHIGAGDFEQASPLSLTTPTTGSSNDMRTAISKMWKHDAFTDLKIIAGNKVFPVHKIILSGIFLKYELTLALRI